ncbi:MAG: hypothetical protein IIT68_04905 [Treponema sp.]|nr:hypothetical protein [Treponema sp.]
MNGFIRTVENTHESSRASVVTFGVLASVSVVLYAVLLFWSPSVPLAVSFATFVCFVVCVSIWITCSKTRPVSESQFVLAMPVRASVRPRLGYRVSRFFMVVSVVLFCAGNCVLCLFELHEPLCTVVFCASAAVAIVTYVTTLVHEKSAG